MITLFKIPGTTGDFFVCAIVAESCRGFACKENECPCVTFPPQNANLGERR